MDLLSITVRMILEVSRGKHGSFCERNMVEKYGSFRGRDTEYPTKIRHFACRPAVL